MIRSTRSVTWATVPMVTDALGVPVTDPDHLQRCVDAANAFAWRRRSEAGYIDDPVRTPGPDVTLGVITYAVVLYRERGTVDSFGSFDAWQSGVVPTSTIAQVLRLLAVPKPAVDLPASDEELAFLAAHRMRARRYG